MYMAPQGLQTRIGSEIMRTGDVTSYHHWDERSIRVDHYQSASVSPLVAGQVEPASSWFRADQLG